MVTAKKKRSAAKKNLIKDKTESYCIIGGGPAGIAAARNLQRFGIPFTGYELNKDFGGLWDINAPRSTVYESAHLISSKEMTEFTEFPMKPEVADYPSHKEVLNYFRDYAKNFDLYKNYRFSTEVKTIEPDGSNWLVTLKTGEKIMHAGVLIANGTLSEPNRPAFEGRFSGRLMHSAEYKKADIFKDKRVLIIGAGNSGCDIAVDSVHYAKKTSMSVRRGYHFVPKYILGKPADAVGGMKLPVWLKQKIDSVMLKLFVGDPVRFGFPKPDHKLYESHPIVNSLILYHLGHGDIDIKPDIDSFHGKKVHFKDGSAEEYDIVLTATGYKLHYPFIDSSLLNWKGNSPQLFLNTFHPGSDSLFVMGMVEASGIGWQGRFEQAELVARYIKAMQDDPKRADLFRQIKSGEPEDLSGGFNYLKLDRMAYYVHKDTFRKKVKQYINLLKSE